MKRGTHSISLAHRFREPYFRDMSRTDPVSQHSQTLRVNPLLGVGHCDCWFDLPYYGGVEVQFWPPEAEFDSKAGCGSHTAEHRQNDESSSHRLASLRRTMFRVIRG
jgi:hypothetical protein